MDTARCKAFIASAETGSFTRAAEQLNYTPSGVSQLVSALEKELGIELLRRTQKGVSLTENGEILMPAAREFVNSENNIFEIASNISGLLVGSVTIASYASVAAYWLPGIIKEFEKAYPWVNIRLIEGIRKDITKLLDDEIADIGIFSYKDNMSYEWIPLSQDPIVVVFPKDHPLAKKKTISMDMLKNERFILPALGHDEDSLDIIKENNIDLTSQFSTLNDISTLSMVEQGLGICLLNSLAVKMHPSNVKMVPLSPETHITLGIAYNKSKASAPAVKKFIEYTTKEILNKT